MEQKNPQKSNVKLRKCDILGKVLARFGFDASNMFQKSWHNKRLESEGWLEEHLKRQRFTNLQ